ncbi:YhjD/YihY/BrkB family envelope integrity protein [Aporhodopirellula aestuarii]|uniref:YihY family inner membrane protein n=1 Tax=Aporhodopirellula aestuarii TaxID=2950107 RepID=A0ABT0U3U4_9BACT|nr:YhjD/YihY/BrkB family envelope integrity protein [Aporhodopirellula aestuarii]MCM2371562.1 YihY family inner membrane protein [Aporhodopirellula aestuarii]
MPNWLTYLFDAIRRPREELSKRQHQLRYGWDLVVYCGRQLERHRAEGMAAELTYRTIFSLIPVVVLGLVMFRVVGGLEDVQTRVENQLYSFFGVPEIPIQYLHEQAEEIEQESEQAKEESERRIAETLAGGENADSISGEFNGPSGNAGSIVSDGDELNGEEPGADVDQALVDAVEQKAGEAATAMEARASIRRTLHEVTSQIATLDFASIGVFGLLLFLYAAVALADSTEHLFNIIYDAPSQRPIHLRLAIHWSIITLGSGLLALSLYMSGQVVDWFNTIGAGSRPTWVLQHALSLLAGWVLLFLLYALMPNTHVSLRAAAIGSAVGAVLWEFAKYGFQIYVSKAVPYSALYGSLGLIPLFLFWIYVTWLIVLFGLILTYTTQTMRGRRLRRKFEDADALPAGDPDWMLPIMTEVASAFRDGKAIGRQELAEELGLSSRVVHEMENHLINGGCLRRVPGAAGEEDRLTLARPAERILISDVLELAHQARPTNNHRAWKTLASLKLAERNAAGEQTLADVIV